VVVYSSAIRANNPELVAAETRHVPVIPRAEMLAEVMRLKDGIAVAGSHGKTTTTSLIAHVLYSAGLDPTAVIGGRVLGSGSAPTGARLGAGDVLVAEADESDGSFLRLAPVIAVVTNIDPEHLDHYGEFDTLRDAFVTFTNCVPFWGCAVVCLDHPGVQAIIPSLTRRYTTYGFSSQADWAASEIESSPEGVSFRVRHADDDLGIVRMRLPGRHNVLNALAAIAVSQELDVPFAKIADALETFVGIERRFELKGVVAGIRVVDDYAHHPAEITATLSSARSGHGGRIVAAFQPHRYSRTRDVWDEFLTAFNDADVLFLSEVYAAGEDKIPGVESAPLAEAIRAHGHRDVRFVVDIDDVLDGLVAEARSGDLVLTLGAGSITTLGGRLVERLEAERG
jgi:UDP-N-acetylmuramate--alanine ligase